MRKVLIGLSVVGVVLLGFFREFIFIHINEHLFALWYDEPSRALQSLPILEIFDYETLYASKWILTVLFAGLFYAASIGVLSLLYAKRFWKELGVIYILLFVGAGLSLAFGEVSY